MQLENQVLDSPIGKRAAKSLPAGRSLAASDIEEMPPLANNAPVTVRVVAGGVEVTTTGRALRISQL